MPLSLIAPAVAIRATITLLACALLLGLAASPASAAPGEFKAGVKGDLNHDGKPFEYDLLHTHVRAFTGDAAKPADRERAAGPPLKGKYGCAESVFNGDGYTSETRGFITLLSGNRYRQGKGAKGRYRYKAGVTRFIGGGLDKSTATALDGKRSRLFITVRFTNGDEARWACTRVGKG